MDVALDPSKRNETDTIQVHYWASARAAAGVSGDEIAVEGPITLDDVVRRAAALHPGTRLPDVLKVCSVLVGDRPVSSEDPGDVVVQPGSTVEFLPPFAGG
jgi:molybdopterin synthase sulfur carrier subunit